MIECQICNSKFNSRRALAIHVTKAHPKIKWKLYKRQYENYCIDKPFICEICHSCYSTPNGLIAHIIKTEKISKDEYLNIHPDIKDKIILYLKTFLKNKYKIDNKTGCWNWCGRIDDDGYGVYNTDRAHRLFYEMYIGIIPDKFLICHKCDNPQCVNPGHLYPGTVQDNMNDMKDRGRSLTGDKNPAKRPEVRKKISINNPMLNEEHRRTLSKRFKGRKHPRYNYQILSPDSKLYNSDNLFQFCKKMKLDYRHFLDVASGKRQNPDGWTIRRVMYE